MALPKIDLPRYTVTIPSTGEELSMRPYLVKEEKVLLMALESEDSKQITMAIRNLIESCIEGVNLDKLAGFDVEKLFLELRGVSVGETINLMGNCSGEGCDGQTPVQISTKDITMTDLEPDANVIKLTDTVGVTMSYPTANTLRDVGLDALDTVEGLMDLIISCVDTIFDSEQVHNVSQEDSEEVKDFIESLTTDQFQKISAFFSKTPRLEYNLEFECVKCKKQNQQHLRGLANFFT